jgi:hypothetical protein
MRWQMLWIGGMAALVCCAVAEAQPPRQEASVRDLEMVLGQVREIERRLSKLSSRLDEMAAGDKEARERKAKEAARAKDEAKPKGRPEAKEKAKPEAKKDGPPDRRFGPPGPGRPGFGPWRPPMGDRWGRPGFGPRGGAMPGPWGGFRPFDFRRPDRPDAREDAARRAEQIAEQLERLARELRRH